MKAGDIKWGVDKTDKPQLPAPPWSSLFWDMLVRADVLFGVEQP